MELEGHGIEYGESCLDLIDKVSSKSVSHKLIISSLSESKMLGDGELGNTTFFNLANFFNFCYFSYFLIRIFLFSYIYLSGHVLLVFHGVDADSR